MEGVASRLKQALSHVSADLRSLLSRLNLRELHTILKRAHLAALASLLARAQTLHRRLGEVLLIEESSDDVDSEHDTLDVANWRDWGAGKTRNLLAALARGGFGGSEEDRARILCGVLNGAAGGAAAGRSVDETMEYVRLLERHFGSADEGGLKFAQECFAEAAQGQPSGESPGRERVQMGLPEEYARADSDLLRLLKVSV